MTSLILSFFEFSGFETNLFKKFVGWKNFIKISNDKYFLIALQNTFLFVFGAVFIQTGIAPNRTKGFISNFLRIKEFYQQTSLLPASCKQVGDSLSL